MSINNVTVTEEPYKVTISGTTITVAALGISSHRKRSVEAGITATVSGSQGQGALTKDINEISVVANENDAVTLPTAAAGREITIINNGANILKIWPASGDNLGAGADTATTLIAGATVTFMAYNSTNWSTV